eukprot:scaffold24999_cov63-Phaeocystis_antarctica.AAC.12
MARARARARARIRMRARMRARARPRLKDAVVARERDEAAPRRGVAADGGHSRQRRHVQREPHLLHRRPEGGQLVRRPAVHRAQVHAGREDALHAGAEDHAAHLWVGLERERDRLELLAHCLRQAVDWLVTQRDSREAASLALHDERRRTLLRGGLRAQVPCREQVSRETSRRRGRAGPREAARHRAEESAHDQVWRGRYL